MTASVTLIYVQLYFDSGMLLLFVFHYSQNWFKASFPFLLVRPSPRSGITNFSKRLFHQNTFCKEKGLDELACLVLYGSKRSSFLLHKGTAGILNRVCLGYHCRCSVSAFFFPAHFQINYGYKSRRSIKVFAVVLWAFFEQNVYTLTISEIKFYQRG